MSDKKASSGLPSGPVDLGYASSYGIDSLVPVHDRGEGPLDKARLPEAKGISALPEGILSDPEVSSSDLPDSLDPEHSDAGELSNLIASVDKPLGFGWLSDSDLDEAGYEESPKIPPLTDLTWLSQAEQDPSRLPHRPHSIPELVEEWGVGRRTDGIHFFNDNIPQQPVISKTLPVLSVQDMTRKAMREIASGSDAADTLKQLPENIRTVVASEIGLNGKVFIRAEAYTDCASGKWNETVRKTASSADYVLSKKACSGCIRNINGSCEMFGKKVVASVPWKEAYSKYASRLKTAGYQVPNTGNFQQDLKGSFLVGPSKVARETPFPILQDQTAGLTFGAAFEGLKGVQTQFELISKEARETDHARKLVRMKLAKWLEGKFLTLSQYEQLSSSKAHPKAIMKAASEIADLNTIKSAKYSNPSGMQSVSQVSAEQAWGALKQSEQEYSRKSREVREKLARDVKSRVSDLTKTGLITQKEASTLLSAPTLKDIVAQASALLSKKLSSPGPLKGSASKVGSYTGVGVGASKIKQASEAEVADTLRTREQALRNRDTSIKHYIQAKKASAVAGYAADLQRAGVLSEADLHNLDMTGSSDEVLSRIATLVSQKSLSPTKIDYKTSKVSSYSGEGIGTMFGTPEQVSFGDAWNKLTGSKRTLVASPVELRGVIKFAKQHMNEGVAGKALDQLLEARFSKPLLKAAEDILSSEREKHEGLAGHLYVDASLYASPSGTTGCEKGSMQHRANAVPYVLAMSKCASCVFKNANNTCQKYNKEIVSNLSSAVDDVAGYQLETIKLANATEQEKVQALFVPSHDIVSEFGVGKKATDLDIDPEPEYNGLDGVVFGDFDLE